MPPLSVEITQSPKRQTNAQENSLENTSRLLFETSPVRAKPRLKTTTGDNAKICQAGTRGGDTPSLPCEVILRDSEARSLSAETCSQSHPNVLAANRGWLSSVSPPLSGWHVKVRGTRCNRIRSFPAGVFYYIPGNRSNHPSPRPAASSAAPSHVAATSTRQNSDPTRFLSPSRSCLLQSLEPRRVEEHQAKPGPHQPDRAPCLALLLQPGAQRRGDPLPCGLFGQGSNQRPRCRSLLRKLDVWLTYGLPFLPRYAKMNWRGGTDGDDPSLTRTTRPARGSVSLLFRARGGHQSRSPFPAGGGILKKSAGLFSTPLNPSTTCALHSPATASSSLRHLRQHRPNCRWRGCARSSRRWMRN
jgi:hypothetical protein